MKSRHQIIERIESWLDRAKAARQALEREAATDKVRGHDRLIDDYNERIARADQTVKVLSDLHHFIVEG